MSARASRTLTGALASACLVATAALGSAGSAASATPERPAVVDYMAFGHTVKGRVMRAWEIGDPNAATTVVVMATIHGNEPAPRLIVRTLRDGAPVTGVNMWLVPLANPDGFVRHTRKNAHGVDLNRNFPWRWARLYGSYYSGNKPASEPETRALMRFFTQVAPDYVVSFHQPLHGVDVSTRKSRAFARRLADALNLPRKNLTCGGLCHGTFTQWFNHKFPGVAVTAEYGAHPSRHRMVVVAPRQLLHLFGAHR